MTGAYLNFKEDIVVDVYNSLNGTSIQDSIIGLANGVTVDLAAEKIPEVIKEALKEDKGIPNVKWILSEEEGKTRLSVVKDCKVNIDTGNAKRDFILNEAMYKALNGLVVSNEYRECNK